jgi:hypothetical protein
MDTVTIGCRLPNGYCIEVGFSVNVPGAGGASFAMYQKHEDYAAFTLKGTNQHLILRDPLGKPLTTLASQRDREPFINLGVPADLWNRWTRENPKNWALRTGQIFLIPKADAATVKAVSADAKATSPAILEPLDPTAKFNVEGTVLEKRRDEE